VFKKTIILVIQREEYQCIKYFYKVFLNTLVATSWNVFAGDIAVKSRDAIKLHQEKYNVNSVIPHNVLASDYIELDGIVISIYWILCKYSLNINDVGSIHRVW